MAREEAERVQRIQRGEDRGRLDDAIDADRADGDEPRHGDRAEELSDGRGAPRLQREEREQHADGDRHDVGLERARADFEPLDRGKHGDRGREHGVAVEERGAEHADEEQRDAPLLVALDRLLRERDERHDAALAAVVGAHDEHHIFERHDDHQRPEDRGEAAENVGVAEGDAVIGREGLLYGVQRARADVAEHDAERGKRQRGERGFAMAEVAIQRQGRKLPLHCTKSNPAA